MRTTKFKKVLKTPNPLRLPAANEIESLFSITSLSRRLFAFLIDCLNIESVKRERTKNCECFHHQNSWDCGCEWRMIFVRRRFVYGSLDSQAKWIKLECLSFDESKSGKPAINLKFPCCMTTIYADTYFHIFSLRLQSLKTNPPSAANWMFFPPFARKLHKAFRLVQ